LLDRNPMVGYSFLKHMARDLEEAEEAKLHAAALPVRARLAHLLLMLRERFGQPMGTNGARIELPLSRQDIAAMIGTRPETVARAVRGFEDEGIANFQGREVLVPNLEGLLNELNSAE
jgi:CRP-like cAMP-binding protein